MKVPFTNLKRGEIKVHVEHADDLWYLSQLIDPGDTISGKTVRKIKKNDESDPSKKAVFLSLVVENVDLEATLRVSGKVNEGPEDIPLGSYHTFTIEQGSIVTIIKPKWYTYQLDRLKEAQTEKRAPLLICVFDREEVYFAKTTLSGYQVLAQLAGNVTRKRTMDEPKTSFWDEIVKHLSDYDKRYSPQKIILASPSFWKEELLKHLTDNNLRKKLVQATCSSVTKNAIDEVLRRPEVKEALAQERVAHEMQLVEELFAAIAKNIKFAYGMKQVLSADENGAVAHLLITDGLIARTKRDNTFLELDRLMKSIDSKKGQIHLISSEHSGGKSLDGIGGIGALLRFTL